MSPLEQARIVSLFFIVNNHFRSLSPMDVADEVIRFIDIGCRRANGTGLAGCMCIARRAFVLNTHSISGRLGAEGLAQMERDIDVLVDICSSAFGGQDAPTIGLRALGIFAAFSRGDYTTERSRIRLMFGASMNPMTELMFSQSVVAVSNAEGNLNGARHWLWRWTELIEQIYGRDHERTINDRRNAANAWDALGEHETARVLREGK